MAFDAFLKISTIPGESTDGKHSEWIELISFHHGMSQPASAQVSTRGGITTGRVDVQDFTVEKALDKASPKLALACCKGEHIPSVIIELCKNSGDKQKYMEYKLTDVVVSAVAPVGVRVGTAPTDTPQENVSFRFSKIEWNYVSLDNAGRPKGNVAAGWDLNGNKPV